MKRKNVSCTYHKPNVIEYEIVSRVRMTFIRLYDDNFDPFLTGDGVCKSLSWYKRKQCVTLIGMAEVFEIVDNVITEHEISFQEDNPRDFIDCFMQKKMQDSSATVNNNTVEAA